MTNSFNIPALVLTPEGRWRRKFDEVMVRLTIIEFLDSDKCDNFDKTWLMTPSSQHSSLADYYFGLVKNLNANSKLDLIAKLSQSLKEVEAVPGVPLQALFGAYASEETADEIIASLRASRVFNRNIESL